MNRLRKDPAFRRGLLTDSICVRLICVRLICVRSICVRPICVRPICERLICVIPVRPVHRFPIWMNS